MKDIVLPEYDSIDDYEEKNKKALTEIKAANKGKKIYHMRINLMDFGNFYGSFFLPTAGQINVIRTIQTMEPQDLDAAYNTIYSHLMVCPDKANFAVLYRTHGQIGLVNSICNMLLKHAGFGGDAESKKDMPPVTV